MSDRHTSIIAPGADYGWAENGRKTRTEMIRHYRKHAQVMLQRAQAILATDDDDFIVETYIGRHVKRDLKAIPPDRAAKAASHTTGGKNG